MLKIGNEFEFKQKQHYNKYSNTPASTCKTKPANMTVHNAFLFHLKGIIWQNNIPETRNIYSSYPSLRITIKSDISHIVE